MSEQANKDRQHKYFESNIGKIFKLFVSINGYQYTYTGKLLEVWEDKILIHDIKSGDIPISFEGITVLTVREDNQ